MSRSARSNGVRADPEDSDQFSRKPLSVEFFQFSDRIFEQIPALNKIRLEYIAENGFTRRGFQTYMGFDIDRPRSPHSDIKASNRRREYDGSVYPSRIALIVEAIRNNTDLGSGYNAITGWYAYQQCSHT